MAATDFLALKGKNDPLVLSALDWAVLAHVWEPGGGYMPTNITDAAGILQELPAGWETVGEIQKKAGVDLAPDLKTTNIDGYGSAGPRRVIPIEESFKIDYTPQEWRKINQAIWHNVPLAALGSAAAGTGFKHRKTSKLGIEYYSLLLIAQDGPEGSELYPWFGFVKGIASGRGKLSGQIGAEIALPISWTPLDDGDWGGVYDFGVAGAGFDAIAEDAGFTLTPSVPLISGRVPATGTFATAGGATLALTGHYFTGTTGVSVGGTAATSFLVVDDNTISITLPAKAAGPHNVVVTNATGASAGFAITYA